MEVLSIHRTSVWDTTFDQLHNGNTMAYRILYLVAYLSPDNIDKDMIESAVATNTTTTALLPPPPLSTDEAARVSKHIHSTMTGQ